MSKTEFVDAFASKAGVTKKEGAKLVDAFLGTVTDELRKGGKVQLVGFGTFDVAERAEREGRNPQTHETIKIAASKAPRFKAGKALKDAVNGKTDAKEEASE